MATTPNFGLWSADTGTNGNIASITSTMQASVDAALVGVNNYFVGNRGQRLALAAPKLKKYVKFFEQDYNIEWLYTGSGWKRVGGVVPGWTDLRPNISFRSGWRFLSMSGSASGIKARRIDNIVEIHINGCVSDAKKFKIPVHGDLNPNQVVFTGIPQQFRPAFGDYGTVNHGPGGPHMSALITASGEFVVNHTMPWATQTGPRDVDRRWVSGKATFQAASF